MNRRWPAIFMQDAKVRPGMVFGQEPNQPLPGDCDNCGGNGYMFAFYVKRGPYLKVPPHQFSNNAQTGDRREHIHAIEDPIYGYKWYVGEMKSQPCPICKGSGAKIRQAKKPVRAKELEPA